MRAAILPSAPPAKRTGRLGINFSSLRLPFTKSKFISQKKPLVSEKLFVRAAILPSAPPTKRTGRLGINFSSLRLPYNKSKFISQKKLFVSEKLFVRAERLELSNLAAPDPKSGVSTNFTTPALLWVQIYTILANCKVHLYLFSINPIK